MPQNPFVRPSLAISYCTSMSRPDAALALAAIHGFESRRQSRAGAICVAGAGLDAAIFCDIVGRFYTVGPVPNANDVLPIGLDIVSPMPPDQPMVRAVVEKKNEKGEPLYPRSLRKVSDTSQAEAMLRNGVTLQKEATFVLSAPATVLARCLDLLGVKELFAARVKRLVIVDTGEPRQDVQALRKVIREWPTSIALCGSGGGELRFPGEFIDAYFTWTPSHPVADAYRAFRPAPYNAPAHDLVAVFFASQPDSGFFEVSAPGTITVSDAGVVSFTAGGGTAVNVTTAAAKRSEAMTVFKDVTSAKPVAPTRAGRPPV